MDVEELNEPIHPDPRSFSYHSDAIAIRAAPSTTLGAVPHMYAWPASHGRLRRHLSTVCARRANTPRFPELELDPELLRSIGAALAWFPADEALSALMKPL